MAFNSLDKQRMQAQDAASFAALKSSRPGTGFFSSNKIPPNKSFIDAATQLVSYARNKTEQQAVTCEVHYPFELTKSSLFKQLMQDLKSAGITTVLLANKNALESTAADTTPKLKG